MTAKFVPEFSRLISVSDIEKDRMVVNIAANSLECHGLAERFSIEHLERLEARLTLLNLRCGGVFRVDASFIADVTQICIVTLMPIKNNLEGEFFCKFVTDDMIDRDPVVEFELDDMDPAEVLINGSFDVGELVSEHLGLEIDPFPRAEKAVFQQINEFNCEHEMTQDSPFQILKILHTIEK